MHIGGKALGEGGVLGAFHSGSFLSGGGDELALGHSTVVDGHVHVDLTGVAGVGGDDSGTVRIDGNGSVFALGDHGRRHFAFSGHGSQRVVGGSLNSLGGDGSTGQGIDSQRSALADELVQVSFILGAAGAEAGSFVGRIDGDVGNLAAFDGQGDGNLGLEALSSRGHGGAGGSGSGSQSVIRSSDDGVGGDGRAGQSIDSNGSALANELVQERFILGAAGAEAGGLVGGVDDDGSDLAAVNGQGNGDLGLEALSGSGHSGTGGSRSGGQLVQRIDDSVGGDGRTGQHVDVLARGKGSGLADELVQERLILGAAGAEAGGLVGRVDLDGLDSAVGVEGRGNLNFALEALSGSGVAGHSGLGGFLLGGLTEGQQVAFSGSVAQSDLIDALERSVGSVQHGGRGDGRAGQALDGAALGNDQAFVLSLIGLGAHAGAQALGLSKVAVADHGSGHHAIHADAHGDGNGALVTGLGSGHAVADDLIAVLGGVEAVDFVTTGNGDLFVVFSRHDAAESFHQLSHAAFLDRAFRDRVGHGQHDGGDQSDQRQRQVGGELLFLGLVVFHFSLPPSGFPVLIKEFTYPIPPG